MNRHKKTVVLASAALVGLWGGAWTGSMIPGTSHWCWYPHYLTVSVWVVFFVSSAIRSAFRGITKSGED